MVVYILSHADVKYLFSSISCWRYQLLPELGMRGQRMLNLQWEMGDGKREITDPAARSLAALQDSAGWSVKGGRSQRDMGKWQTGRGLRAHEPWPMSTGTVSTLSAGGPFAR